MHSSKSDISLALNVSIISQIMTKQKTYTAAEDKHSTSYFLRKITPPYDYGLALADRIDTRITH